MKQPSNAGVTILTAAGAFDLLLALLFATTPVLSAYVGGSAALITAAVLAIGGVALIVIARIRGRAQRDA